MTYINMLHPSPTLEGIKCFVFWIRRVYVKNLVAILGAANLVVRFLLNFGFLCVYIRHVLWSFFEGCVEFNKLMM